MLYLEARCLSLVRAAGSQGVQNGSISCVALVLSVPGGTREILAENLIAAWLDLEVASGNDAIASHSPTRRTAKLMGQFLPGTDFVTSGWSVMPRYDNMFGGGNYDADDIDEWLTIQRDWQVDGGIEPLGEAETIAVRERAARAIQAVFAAFGFPPVTDAEVEAATYGYDSRDLPDRDRAADVARRRPRACRGDHRARRRARARRARLHGRGGRDPRHAAPAGLGRLPPDLGDHRLIGARDGGGQRSEPVLGAGHGLPPGGRALGAAAGAAARARPARARRDRAAAGRGADRPRSRRGGARGRRRRGRDRARAGLRRRAACDDRRPGARRGSASRGRGRPRGRRRAEARARAARLRRGVHRPRRRGAVGVGRRGRPAVEGHGADPPRRPGAARQPRSCSGWRRR